MGGFSISHLATLLIYLWVEEETGKMKGDE